MDARVAESYTRARNHELTIARGQTLPGCYGTPPSIGAWLALRMHRTVLPLLEAYPGNVWMSWRAPHNLIQAL